MDSITRRRLLERMVPCFQKLMADMERWRVASHEIFVELLREEELEASEQLKPKEGKELSSLLPSYSSTVETRRIAVPVITPSPRPHPTSMQITLIIPPPSPPLVNFTPVVPPSDVLPRLGATITDRQTLPHQRLYEEPINSPVVLSEVRHLPPWPPPNFLSFRLYFPNWKWGSQGVAAQAIDLDAYVEKSAGVQDARSFCVRLTFRLEDFAKPCSDMLFWKGHWSSSRICACCCLFHDAGSYSRRKRVMNAVYFCSHCNIMKALKSYAPGPGSVKLGVLAFLEVNAGYFYFHYIITKALKLEARENGNVTSECVIIAQLLQRNSIRMPSNFPIDDVVWKGLPQTPYLVLNKADRNSTMGMIEVPWWTLVFIRIAAAIPGGCRSRENGVYWISCILTDVGASLIFGILLPSSDVTDRASDSLVFFPELTSASNKRAAVVRDNNLKCQNGDYVVWVSSTSGPFWVFQQGWVKCFSGARDNALYPILFIDSLKSRIPVLVLLTVSLTYMNYRCLTVVGSIVVFLDISSIFPCIIMGFIAILRFQASKCLMVDSNHVNWKVFLNTLSWNLNYWELIRTLEGEVHNSKKMLTRALSYARVLVVLGYFLPLLIRTRAMEPVRELWSEGYFSEIVKMLDDLGRRPLLIAVVSGIALSLSLLAAYYKIMLGLPIVAAMALLRNDGPHQESFDDLPSKAIIHHRRILSWPSYWRTSFPGSLQLAWYSYHYS